VLNVVQVWLGKSLKPVDLSLLGSPIFMKGSEQRISRKGADLTAFSSEVPKFPD
jgi:hypothetical protein